MIPRQRNRYSSRTYVLPEDFPQRLKLFQEESGLSWSEIARRLEPGKNVRWEITITPGSGADVDIALNATTDCSAQGAICTIASVGVYYFQCRVNMMVVLHLKAHLAFFLSVS